MAGRWFISLQGDKSAQANHAYLPKPCRANQSSQLIRRPDFLEASPNDAAIFIMKALLKRPRTFSSGSLYHERSAISSLYSSIITQQRFRSLKPARRASMSETSTATRSEYGGRVVTASRARCVRPSLVLRTATTTRVGRDLRSSVSPRSFCQAQRYG